MPHIAIYFQFAFTRSTICLQQMRPRSNREMDFSATANHFEKLGGPSELIYRFEAAAAHRFQAAAAYCEQETFWRCRPTYMVATAIESKRWMDGQLMYLLNHWFMVTPEKEAPVTGTTLRTTGPVLTDSRQWTPSVRICVTG